MSENFIIEFESKIEWEMYFYFQEASLQILKRFIFKTGFKETGNFKMNHLTETEKKELEKLLNLKYMFIN